MPASKTKIIVALSGTGRTLQNLLDHQDKYEVIGVISSNETCYGNEIAKQHNLPLFLAKFIPKTLVEDGKNLEKWLLGLKPSFIVLAGFLKIFPIFSPYSENRIINIHPALLPKYGGKGMYGDNVHKAVSESGEDLTGATVHFVNENYDEGKIIAQIKVSIQPNQNYEIIAKEVFKNESILLPKVIEGLIEGSLPLADSKILMMEGI